MLIPPSDYENESAEMAQANPPVDLTPELWVTHTSKSSTSVTTQLTLLLPAHQTSTRIHRLILRHQGRAYVWSPTRRTIRRSPSRPVRRSSARPIRRSSSGSVWRTPARSVWRTSAGPVWWAPSARPVWRTSAAAAGPVRKAARSAGISAAAAWRVWAATAAAAVLMPRVDFEGGTHQNFGLMVDGTGRMVERATEGIKDYWGYAGDRARGYLRTC